METFLSKTHFFFVVSRTETGQSVRDELANANPVRSHCSHDFRSYYEYPMHCRSEDFLSY